MNPDYRLLTNYLDECGYQHEGTFNTLVKELKHDIHPEAILHISVKYDDLREHIWNPQNQNIHSQ